MRPMDQEERWRHERWSALAQRVCDIERQDRGSGKAFQYGWSRRHGKKSATILRRLCRLHWKAAARAREQAVIRRQPR